MDHVERLLRAFFVPPPFPVEKLPIIARAAKKVVEEIYTKVYFMGVFEGLVMGVLLALIFLPRRPKGGR